MTLNRQVNIETSALFGTFLSGPTSVAVWLYSCVGECSGEKWCKWPSNGNLSEGLLIEWLHLKKEFKH